MECRLYVNKESYEDWLSFKASIQAQEARKDDQFSGEEFWGREEKNEGNSFVFDREGGIEAGFLSADQGSHKVA